MVRMDRERGYRGDEWVARVRGLEVCVCGAGALGGHVVEGLARVGFGRVRVVDFDRVEERNLSGQPYGRRDVGQLKASTLAKRIYRELGVDVAAECVRLEPGNAAMVLAGAELVVDVFDNTESRALVQRVAAQVGAACLHVGMAAGYAEAVWDPGYRVPEVVSAQEDPCGEALARNLGVIAAAAACERVAQWVSTGERRGWTLTLGDLRMGEL